MPDCPGWDRAQALAEVVRASSIPGLELRMVDLTGADAVVPESVIASPTWVLDERRIALGNPDPEWLLALLRGLTGGE